MFARCVYSDTVHFTVGESYSVDLLNGCKRGAVGIHYVKDNDDDPHWESSNMDRWHMQTLLDNGLIYRKP